MQNINENESAFIRRNPFPSSASDFFLPLSYGGDQIPINQFDTNPFILRNRNNNNNDKSNNNLESEDNPLQKRRVSDGKA